MSLADFQNEKSRLSEMLSKERDERQSKLDEQMEKYKENVKDPLEGIASSGVEDTSLNLVKNVIGNMGKKVINKLGITPDTIKAFTDKIDKIDKKELLRNPKKALKKAFEGSEDDEGIQALLKKTLESKIKNVVPKELTDKLPGITRDVKTAGKKVLKQGKTVLEDGTSRLTNLTDGIPSLDADIARALPINPSSLDIQSASLRQQMRNPLKLDDDLSRAQAEARPVRLFPEEEEEDAIRPVARGANIADDVKGAGARVTAGIGDEEAKAAAQAIAKREASALAEKETKQGIKKTVEKAGEKFLKVDAETGGPEGDLLGDVVAGIASLGTMIFGIKHKPKTASLPPITRVNPSLQLGLDIA